MKLKIKKIVIKERNVFIGFLVITLIITFLIQKSFWVIGIFLYLCHLAVMMSYYIWKNSQKE